MIYTAGDMFEQHCLQECRYLMDTFAIWRQQGVLVNKFSADCGDNCSDNTKLSVKGCAKTHEESNCTQWL